MSANNPRAIVVINGKSYNPQSFEIVHNANGVIDTATIVLPTKGNPDFPSTVQAGKGIPVSIYAGYPSNPTPGGYSYQQLRQRFTGTINETDTSFSLDADTVSLPCISFGAILTRTKTTTNLGGITASTPAGFGAGNLAGITTVQYVESVAAQHGMVSDVAVDSPASLQEVFTTNQIVGVKNMRIWDVLLACAITDGAYVWFTGNVLHYMDPTNVSLERAILPIQYATLTGPKSFDGNHALQYSKNIKVEVRSYRTKERTSYRSTISPTSNGVAKVSTSRSFTRDNFGNPGSSVTRASTIYASDGTSTTTTSTGSTLSTGGETSSGYLSAPSDSTNETYIFKRWGLDQAACDKLALTLWKQLSAHEYRGTFTLPITPDLASVLDITNKYRVSGLDWASFDQDYIALRQTEEFSKDGWTVEIIGINHRLPQNLA